MKVSELIEELKKMPSDALVTHLWDGSARTNIEHVWLSRGRYVVTADRNEMCYGDEDRPLDAPDEKTNLYWKTPGEKR